MNSLILEPGSTVSHFRLERKLGEGGMGAVYLAEDLTLARKVAIKFMNRALIGSQTTSLIRDSLAQRFIREARSAAAINHPHVAQIYEASFETDLWFIAMEFIDGKNLIDILNDQGRFAYDELREITRQTVSGLKFAWEQHKILHRDIKPHNLMRTRDGVIKIVDLGLAKPVLDPDEQETAINLTCDGIAVGTPQYMAPEQAAGEPILDCRVDIYSLGATLYELCTGQKSFAASSPALIYTAQMCRDYTRIPELCPELPAEFADLIDRMLEPKQAVRLNDYDEILRILDRGPKAKLVIPPTPAPATAAVAPEHDIDDLLIDRYRVIRHLGQSRAGIAYLCVDTQLKVECVVKSLMPDREFAAADMAMITRNFQNLMSMSHPNLVQIRDLRRESNGELLVVMEKLDGINLRQYTHQQITEHGHLELPLALPVLHLVASAIDAVNRTFASTHNDIKPESLILINNATHVKLLDYGITARPLANSSTSASRIKVNQPMPLESPDYLAPEKWADGAITTLADQYSLGVIVYEMLSRKLPFWLNDPRHDPQTAEDENDRLRQRLTGLRRQVLETRPELLPDQTPAVNAVVLKALAKDPDSRYPDAATFIGELERAGRPSQAGLAIAVAAAVLLVLVGAGYFGYRACRRVPEPQPNPVQPVPPRSDDEEARRQAEEETRRQQEEGRRQQEEGRRQQEAEARRIAEEARRKEEAEAEQRAEEEAKKQEEERRRQAELKAEAERQALIKRKLQDDLDRFRKSFAERRDAIKDLPSAADVLKAADAQAAVAARIDPEQDLKGAVVAWQDAVAKLAQADSDLTRNLRKRADDLHDQVEKHHQTVKRWEDWDPEIGERLIGFDVTYAMARDLRQQEDFAKAVASYEKADLVLTGIEKLVAARYTPDPGKDFLVGRVRMDMVWIRELKLWVGKYEITNGQFRKFKPRHTSKKHEGLSLNDDQQPVCWISYFDAVAFCAWLNNDARLRGSLPDGFEYRLPTKKEWQTFATAGKPEQKYPWGNDWPPPWGNFGDQEMFPTEWKLKGYTDNFPVTCPVTRSGENRWGLFGVAGNLWEWTTERKGDNRAVFGGAWSSCDPRQLEVEVQGNNFADPQQEYDNVGFRVLLAPKLKDE